MFKINRRVFCYCIAALFGSSLAAAVGAFNDSESLSKDVYGNSDLEEKNDDLYGVSFLDNAAVIIPEENLYISIYDDEGFCRKINAFGDNVVLFNSDAESSAYDKAYSYAVTLLGDDAKVYDYSDTVSKSITEPLNDNTLYGVSFFNGTAVIIPEENLYISTYDDEGFCRKINAFGDNVILFSSDAESSAYDKAYSFAITLLGDAAKVYDYSDTVSNSFTKSL